MTSIPRSGFLQSLQVAQVRNQQTFESTNERTSVLQQLNVRVLSDGEVKTDLALGSLSRLQRLRAGTKPYLLPEDGQFGGRSR